MFITYYLFTLSTCLLVNGVSSIFAGDVTVTVASLVFVDLTGVGVLQTSSSSSVWNKSTIHEVLGPSSTVVALVVGVKS